MERHLRVVTLPKKYGNIEVRLYVPRVRNGWHRAGTLTLSAVAWRNLIQPLLDAGAVDTGIRLTIEPTAASSAPLTTEHNP
jgi:hypothetical protein